MEFCIVRGLFAVGNIAFCTRTTWITVQPWQRVLLPRRVGKSVTLLSVVARSCAPQSLFINGVVVCHRRMQLL